MTFEQCVIECARNQELIKGFDRLAGTNLQLCGAPIEIMIDEATGRLSDDVRRFVSFVDEWIWTPLLEGEEKTT
jgi:hypothetical protein